MFLLPAANRLWSDAAMEFAFFVEGREKPRELMTPTVLWRKEATVTVSHAHIFLDYAPGARSERGPGFGRRGWWQNDSGRSFR
jgi:hypothetical protein